MTSNPTYLMTLAGLLLALGAGSATAQSRIDLQIPSAGAAGGSIALRLYHPSPGTYRYHRSQGAVVIRVPGGTSAGDLGNSAAVSAMVREGLVVATFLFPGGSFLDPATGAVITSAGTYDQRGINSLRALRDVTRYCLGLRPDASGNLITTTLPGAMTSNVGFVALSNGGNACLSAMGRFGAAMPGVKFYAGWENPSNGQTCTGELGTNGWDPDLATDGNGNGLLNDDGTNPHFLFYRPRNIRMNWSRLTYDPSGVTAVGGTVFAGQAFFDGNGNGKLDLPLDQDGNGLIDVYEDYPLTGYTKDFGSGTQLCYSLPVRRALAALGASLSADVASLANTRRFWSLRELVRALPRVGLQFPNLLSITAFTQVDHVQAAHVGDGHMHIRQLIDGLRTAGLWVRANPDRSYLDLVYSRMGSTSPAGSVDVPALTFGPGLHALAEPETVRTAQLQAAMVTELADRVFTGVTANDLTAPLIYHP
jgi:hypothetical protein